MVDLDHIQMREDPPKLLQMVLRLHLNHLPTILQVVRQATEGMHLTHHLPVTTLPNK